MIVILSGPVGSGKTSFLRRLLSCLGNESIPVAGFFGQRVFQDEELTGYDLIDAATMKRHPFLRKGEGAESETVGPFRIDPAGLAAAASILKSSPPASLLVVDELGPLELAGGGHWPALKPLLDEAGRSFLFVIRDACLEGFEPMLAERPTARFAVRGLNASDVVREIQSHVNPC